MREIHLNGYIDDDIWFGDEITPGILHDELYPQNVQPAEDVRIILNSYGGSCNAATRMYDELSAYPGNVHIIISGTAASAATVLASAANRLEMTPGSLFMIHDPSMCVYGNASDLWDALEMLNVCKESILNIYCRRSFHSRNEISDMMTATTWMDANAAMEYGFIDGIVTAPSEGITNAAFTHSADRAEAEKKVNAWVERHKPGIRTENTVIEPAAVNPVPDETPEIVPDMTEPYNSVPAEQLHKRLELLKPHDIFARRNSN